MVRLVGGGTDHPFLAFSPQITMEDSSVPFRAFLGAPFSAFKGVVVEASVFDEHQILEAIDEDEGGEEGSPHVSDADNDSGEYRARSGQRPVGSGPITRARAALSVRPSWSPFSQ